jgi:hypothetical protein
MKKTLIEKWIDWNEKKITSHDFCMEFEKLFRKEIGEKIKQKMTLQSKIKRQMVID